MHLEGRQQDLFPPADWSSSDAVHLPLGRVNIQAITSPCKAEQKAHAKVRPPRFLGSGSPSY